jgi:hypothetical protein
VPGVNYPTYPFVNDDGKAHFTRQRIYDFIFDRRIYGVKPNEIWGSDMWKKSEKSRQWGHKCLKILKKQNLIFENNHKYYPTNSDLNNICWFASRMDYLSPILAFSYRAGDDGDQLSPSLNTTPVGILKSKTRGSLSPKFCKTKFSSQNSNEKCIFEFANRLGAFITYIFIQSMKLSSSPDDSKKDRMEKSGTLIHNAINMRHWHELFCELIDNFGLVKLPLTSDSLNFREQGDTGDILNHQELDQKSFDKLCRIFENVYPGIYNGLEGSWRKVVEDSINIEQYYASRVKRECKHTIKDITIYKYPRKCYSCSNCQSFSHDESFSKLRAEDMPLVHRTAISGIVGPKGFLNTRT